MKTRTIIDTIIDLFKDNVSNKEVEEEIAYQNNKGIYELANRGKSSMDRWKIENNYINKLVCVYDFTKEEKELLKEPLSVMRNGGGIEYFRPIVVNFNIDDTQRKYPIYHYLKTDIEMFKKVLETQVINKVKAENVTYA